MKIDFTFNMFYLMIVCMITGSVLSSLYYSLKWLYQDYKEEKAYQAEMKERGLL